MTIRLVRRHQVQDSYCQLLIWLSFSWKSRISTWASEVIQSQYQILTETLLIPQDKESANFHTCAGGCDCPASFALSQDKRCGAIYAPDSPEVSDWGWDLTWNCTLVWLLTSSNLLLVSPGNPFLINCLHMKPCVRVFLWLNLTEHSVQEKLRQGSRSSMSNLHPQAVSVPGEGTDICWEEKDAGLFF